MTRNDAWEAERRRKFEQQPGPRELGLIVLLSAAFVAAIAVAVISQ